MRSDCSTPDRGCSVGHRLRSSQNDRWLHDIRQKCLSVSGSRSAFSVPVTAFTVRTLPDVSGLLKGEEVVDNSAFDRLEHDRDWMPLPEADDSIAYYTFPSEYVCGSTFVRIMPS